MAQSSLQNYKTKTTENAADRTEILNVARAAFMKQGYPEFKFVITDLLVKDGFAFLRADVVNKDGSTYQLPNEQEGDCCHVEALVKKENNKWKNLEAVAFSMDVWWLCIWKQYKAPKEIFGEASGGDECNN